MYRIDVYDKFREWEVGLRLADLDRVEVESRFGSPKLILPALDGSRIKVPMINRTIAARAWLAIDRQYQKLGVM